MVETQMIKKVKSLTNKYNSNNKTKRWGPYRSGLELYCAMKLTECMVAFEYESQSFVLVEAFNFDSKEKWRKKWQDVFKVNKVSYKPDFLIKKRNHVFVIETKGMRTPDFDIRWKLFKQWITNQSDYVYHLYLPSNQKEVDDTIINIIEQLKLIK
jgi:hypothetical protein